MHGIHYLFNQPNKWWAVHTSGSCALFTESTNLFFQQLFHYKSVTHARDSQISFFSNFFITNESHGTIHTFKNYFTTVFLVFSKISSICLKKTILDLLKNILEKFWYNFYQKHKKLSKNSLTFLFSRKKLFFLK